MKKVAADPNGVLVIKTIEYLHDIINPFRDHVQVAIPFHPFGKKFKVHLFVLCQSVKLGKTLYSTIYE